MSSGEGAISPWRMAGLAWPMKCGSCSANVKVEGDAFAVWKCGKDHYFATCSAECQRMFDKKSRKVSDAVEKVERRLNNEGQRNALRRLPPGEREKVKQKAKADSTEGMLLCPADAKADDRAVPHCAHCMVRCGGQAQEDNKAAPPPPPRLAAGQSPAAGGAAAVGLVDDDQLVVLKKESDVIEEEAAPTKKGKAKKGKEKKVRLGSEPYKQIDPDGDSEAAVARPWATKASPGASVWTAGRPTAVEIGQQSKINQLCNTAGCSEQRTRELPVTHADAFFVGPGTTPSAAPRTAVRRAASVVAQAKPGVQPQPAAAAEPTVASMPLSPQPPPPPRLPPDWLAVWNEEGAAYYYWHTPTNHVQWDPPAIAECVCTELWRPLPNEQNTMQLLQGERVKVFWMEEDPDGWAWGHTLEDPTKYAYFPLAVLETMRREAKPRKAGEVCAATERFDAPQEIGGYLSVAAGDRVRLLHPIERPYVWAYAQRISDGESSHDGSPNIGWLPEVVLGDLDTQHRD